MLYIFNTWQVLIKTLDTDYVQNKCVCKCFYALLRETPEYILYIQCMTWFYVCSCAYTAYCLYSLRFTSCRFCSVHFICLCASSWLHVCINVKNSPQLCRAGTGQRQGFQWYHWGYKWWKCGPNQPASPGLSVWSSGTPLTPNSVTAYIHTDTAWE